MLSIHPLENFLIGVLLSSITCSSCCIFLLRLFALGLERHLSSSLLDLPHLVFFVGVRVRQLCVASLKDDGLSANTSVNVKHCRLLSTGLNIIFFFIILIIHTTSVFYDVEISRFLLLTPKVFDLGAQTRDKVELELPL